MISYDFCKGCQRLDDLGFCTAYSTAGQYLRVRLNDCYLGNKGPTYENINTKSRQRIGQQKQKKGR